MGIGLIISLFLAILTAIFGYLIRYKGAYNLIAGYNTMSEEKKKEVDIKELARFMGNICFVLSFIILAAGILISIKAGILGVITYMLIFPVSIYAVIKTQKYDKDNFTSDGKMKGGRRWLIGSVIGFTVIILILMGTLMNASGKPAGYTFEDGFLNISGPYGEKVELGKISSVEVRETLPEIRAKTNGSGLGTKLKGYFVLQDIGEAKLFLDTSKPPFIYLVTDTKNMIINCDDSAATKDLYEKLKVEIQQSSDSHP